MLQPASIFIGAGFFVSMNGFCGPEGVQRRALLSREVLNWLAVYQIVVILHQGAHDFAN